MFLMVYDTETNQWEQLATSVDQAQGRLTAPVSHFSVFCAFTLAEPEALPVTGAPLADVYVSLGLLASGLLGTAVCIYWRKR